MPNGKRGRKQEPSEDKKEEPKRTAAEQALVEAFGKRQRVPSMELHEKPDGTKALQPEIGDAQLWGAQVAEIIKVSNAWAMQDVLNSLATVAWKVEPDKAVNGGLGLIKEIAPQDGLVGMLATQMVTTHRVAMEQLRRAMIPEQTFEGAEASINRANKLMRTFTKQIEALNTYRGKASQQKMTVEHVHVHEGGQAIVGNVAHGEGAEKSKGRTTHAKAQITHAPEPALPCQDEAGDVVPISGHAKR